MKALLARTAVGDQRSAQDRLLYASYASALLVSVSIWLIAVRSPLLLDETGSYWQISAGFSAIWSRQGIYFPGYSYILWLATKMLGTSEVALRIPSILAMLGAAFLLYQAVREVFETDVAIIAVVVFCLDPTVIFESIDVRPYAFAILVTNAAIFVLLRLRRNNSNWLAALFGFLSACILYFHYMFAIMLPAFAICYFVLKRGEGSTLWRQLGVAIGTFVLAFLPVIPGLEYVFRTRDTHVFAPAPSLGNLILSFAPGCLVFGVGIVALVALLDPGSRARQTYPESRLQDWRILFSLSLAIVPILILYGVSVGTPLHVFLGRYQLAAVPGIALFWASVVGTFRSWSIRPLFCLALVISTAFAYVSLPAGRGQNSSWKYALEVAEKNASPDDAPVLICSDFIESDYVAMPVSSVKKSNLFAPLSYYKLSVPVVPLPRNLNEESIRIASSFLREAAERHQRFLVLADLPSYGILAWIEKKASGTDSVRQLGVFEGVKVVEFAPCTGC